ncbi:hypothetical protein Q8F55_004612 [Vanrija albida]|uniref:Uncharacterized protein n=1 Tax=Vanrija albida TaxID=181172 RepID=A0ABR3Q787_9TREE
MSFNCSYPNNPNATACVQPTLGANNTAYVQLRDDEMARAGQCLLEHGVVFTHFEPDPRDEWDWYAVTASTRVGDYLRCPSWCGGPTRESATISLEWEVTNGTAIQVTARPADIVRAVGGPYAERVTSPWVDGLFVLKGSVYLSTFAYAVRVPGWFGECSDGARYRGAALVPDGEGVVLRCVYQD